ncbi:MAG: DUF4105 domain-containing protein [Candidatus Nanoarchaeia archaeon]|nr:DUF4105 domain-containing protein [Candidatus Nanoarchaeia archaeon]
MKLKHCILLVILMPIIIYISIQPSNDRNWNSDQQVLSYAEIDGDLIHVNNIRNFTYKNTTNYQINYYNKTFNLSQLNNLHYIVEPFSDWEGSAHTFFSFEFENQNYLAISIEIRKEVGESFAATKGLFKQYELMYVLGDENDLIKLRTNYRKDNVYMYKINTTKEKMQELFLDMIQRTNELKENPEFYNTLTSTCTTNLVKHINKITPKKVPFSFKILAPGYSDKLAYDLGLIQNKGTFEETKQYYKIDERAEECGDCENFSEVIRV